MEIILLIVAGLIALAGLNTTYRHIGVILFVEFMIMTGYQEVMTDPDYFIWASTEQLAIFYGMKFTIQAGFFMIYMAYNIKGLSIMSGIIMSYLVYSGILALYGIDNNHYEQTMMALSITQLIILLTGVLNANRINFNISWHHSTHTHNKGA